MTTIGEANGKSSTFTINSYPDRLCGPPVENFSGKVPENLKIVEFGNAHNLTDDSKNCCSLCCQKFLGIPKIFQLNGEHS